MSKPFIMNMDINSMYMSTNAIGDSISQENEKGKERKIKREKKSLETLENAMKNIEYIGGINFNRHSYTNLEGRATYTNELDIFIPGVYGIDSVSLKLKTYGKMKHIMVINNHEIYMDERGSQSKYSLFNRAIEMIENRMNMSIGELTEGHMGYIHE